MLKRVWGAESNGKLSHLFIPSKTATLDPLFAVVNLPEDRTETLVPAFTVKLNVLIFKNSKLKKIKIKVEG